MKKYLDYAPSYQNIRQLLKWYRAYSIRDAYFQNTQVLLEGMSGIEGIVPMYSPVKVRDVPLCILILVESGSGDKLRKFLISKEIYCLI